MIAEVERGEYSISDEVEVYSMPGCYSFVHLGNAKFIHNSKEGFVISGNYNGAEYVVHRTPLQTNSLHIEYDWYRIKKDDCIDISTENDSFYLYFKNSKNIVTKMGFATEAIFEMAMREKRDGRKAVKSKDTRAQFSIAN